MSFMVCPDSKPTVRFCWLYGGRRTVSGGMSIWAPVTIMIRLPEFIPTWGVMTCKEPYGSDASSLFNVLTGYSRPPRYNRFVTAPIDMRLSSER